MSVRMLRIKIQSKKDFGDADNANRLKKIIWKLTAPSAGLKNQGFMPRVSQQDTTPLALLPDEKRRKMIFEVLKIFRNSASR